MVTIILILLLVLELLKALAIAIWVPVREISMLKVEMSQHTCIYKWSIAPGICLHKHLWSFQMLQCNVLSIFVSFSL